MRDTSIVSNEFLTSDQQHQRSYIYSTRRKCLVGDEHLRLGPPLSGAVPRDRVGEQIGGWGSRRLVTCALRKNV